MFEGFTQGTAEAGGQRIFYRMAGSGPGLLLLHGFPQTHAMWHAIAPALTDRFTVVVADLRGYGASSKPSDAIRAT
jgi:haloacetate dehalogenase